ncbi:ArsR family transcriptional regulator [Scopulibacillus darangshiensis]|uniref:ArsR family transcriptional regulator n=1 Tax=Scopulibacillus darangshiensis TaxID=442528 RepID=A0A4R2NJ49_9BACL|nr:ArsR family transcriptional regulator [Scopulibacillus darangshiensis]TCP21328.1 ArsR family transcriptional regulator [Scopulibacillus darangshiensis]
MQLDISKNSLPVYEALNSEARLEILQLLSDKKMNIKELAKKLGLSSAIITRHIQKLEKAQLIKSEKVPGKSGMQKLSFLTVDTIEIHFPQKIYHSYKLHTNQLGVGHYTDYHVKPTCGIASTENFIGQVDDPKYFMDAGRMNASLVWFSEGHVEYMIPNLLSARDAPELLEISLELASEFPRSNNVWPSDITFYVNDINIGTWTCPGNFSDVRGRHTPLWWEDKNSQYGLLKHLRISQYDTCIDGKFLSNVVLSDLGIKDRNLLKFKISVESDAKNVGGVTIFGKGFGNHDQGIILNLYYL